MSVDSDVLKNNADQLTRLEALVERGVDYSCDLGDGWTVAVAMAHMAFWDRRAVGLLKLWDGEGLLPDSVYEDLLNNVLLAEWQAIAPEQSAQLAIEAARAVNAAVRALDGDKAAAIAMIGNNFMLARGEHRREHLDQIEQALG